MDKELKILTPKNVFLKFFILFKLFISVIYFIPVFFVFGFGLVINIFLLIIGSGGAKLQNTNNFISGMGYISFFSLIPTIIAIVVFVLAIICCVKFFKKKYSKKMDLILTALLIIVSVFYGVILFDLSLVFLAMVALIFSLIAIVNIFFIIKQ